MRKLLLKTYGLDLLIENGMPFPPIERLIFKKNPLDSVVCQIRFPGILKIDDGTPSEFQERIMEHFPILEDLNYKIAVPEGVSIPPEAIDQVMNSIPKRPRNYQFSSNDGVWKVNLEKGSLALSTTCYTRWTEFKKNFDIPLRALIDIYNPPMVTRIGLRYTDVIRRSILGLESKNWNELLNPVLIGGYGDNIIFNNVRDYQSQLEINLSQPGRIVKIISRLGQHKDNPKEICFIIDSDFYTNEKTQINGISNILNYFNERSSRLIQWSIKEPLKAAMEPTPYE